jgi:hypothetical protein
MMAGTQSSSAASAPRWMSGVMPRPETMELCLGMGREEGEGGEPGEGGRVRRGK